LEILRREAFLAPGLPMVVGAGWPAQIHPVLLLTRDQ
jgi:hypothetical protein